MPLGDQAWRLESRHSRVRIRDVQWAKVTQHGIILGIRGWIAEYLRRFGANCRL